MAENELAPFFARKQRGPENVDDYIEILQSQKVVLGKGLSIKTQIVMDKEGKAETILADSVDESDPEGITIRTAKRRFGLAAKSLGYDFDWRSSADGWLIMKAIPLKPDNENGQA